MVYEFFSYLRKCMVEHSFLEQQRKPRNCGCDRMIAGHYIVQVVDCHGFKPNQFQQRLKLFIKDFIHFCPLHQCKKHGVFRRHAEIVTG